MGRVREEKRRKKIKKKVSEERRSRCGKRSESREHCVFPMICGFGGSKSRLAKAAGAEPAGQMRDEKLHAVVARSTFQSQKCKKLTGWEHFWKLRCRKSARRCGATHMSKSKCTKHTMVGPLLEVEMSKSTFRSQNAQNTPRSEHCWKLRCSKKFTLLWRKAHFQAKSVKH